jgi:hypothetical protein
MATHLFFFRMSGAKRNGSSAYAKLDALMQGGLAWQGEFESCWIFCVPEAQRRPAELQSTKGVRKGRPSLTKSS